VALIGTQVVVAVRALVHHRQQAAMAAAVQAALMPEQIQQPELQTPAVVVVDHAEIIQMEKQADPESLSLDI
jgi:hypothetical protein